MSSVFKLAKQKHIQKNAPIEEEKIISEQIEPIEKKSNVFSIAKKIPKVSRTSIKEEQPESKGKSLARTIYQPISGIMQKATYPLDIISMIGQGEALSELEELEERFPGKIDRKKYLEAVQSAGESFPTQSNVEKVIEKTTGLPLEAKTPLQKALKIGAASASIKPGSLLEKSATGLGTATLSSAAKSVGVSEPIADILGTIGGQAITKGKILPKTHADKELYDNAKRLGFSDAELTPLFQSESKLKKYSHIAKRTNKVKELNESIIGKNGKFSQVYDELKQRAKSSTTIPKEKTKKVTESFYDLLEELEYSKLPTDDKIQAISKLEKGIADIEKGKFSVRSAIDTYQDINKSLRNSGSGQKPLAAVKEKLVEGVEAADKDIAKDFKSINELYSKHKNFEDIFKPENSTTFTEDLIKTGKLMSFVGGIAKLTGHTPDFLSAISLMGAPIGMEASRRLATRLLTDPNFQSIHKNALIAVKNNSPKAAALVTRQIQQLSQNQKDKNKKLLMEQLKVE